MRGWMIALGMAALTLSVPASTQVRTIDPNRPIDADLAPRPPARDPAPVRAYPDEPTETETGPAPAPASPTAPVAGLAPDAATRAADTFERDDLLQAGEDVFGKGAAGFAGVIERILKSQGRPNAYIAGREAAGAFVVGLRYGSGVMTHKVEGQRPVYWTGPSIGFDIGGDADKVFVLVYNLHDSQELFRRFPAAEGRLYAVGGFAATYLRRGNIVLIPVRLGVGWRAGVNVGYMRFSQKSKWLPF
ncbi:DUF1134 domain-containing protein [uncultured Sphingomonas sp.]|uniref:DUF1134 domain-containing protein n=1 Tax=uncultured Sphingomonas sp. TaxID=158754 RepID=UPI0035CB2B60